MYAKTLRAIGQSLESLGIVAFVINKAGQSYLVHCDSLPDLLDKSKVKSGSEILCESPGPGRRKTSLKNKEDALQYDASDVSRLDAQGRRKRRRRYSAQVTGRKRLSQLMRVVGKRLDRVEPDSFAVAWTPAGVSIEYQLSDGQRMREELNEAKLAELMMAARFRRAPRR